MAKHAFFAKGNLQLLVVSRLQDSVYGLYNSRWTKLQRTQCGSFSKFRWAKGRIKSQSLQPPSAVSSVSLTGSAVDDPSSFSLRCLTVFGADPRHFPSKLYLRYFSNVPLAPFRPRTRCDGALSDLTNMCCSIQESTGSPLCECPRSLILPCIRCGHPPRKMQMVGNAHRLFLSCGSLTSHSLTGIRRCTDAEPLGLVKLSFKSRQNLYQTSSVYQQRLLLSLDD